MMRYILVVTFIITAFALQVGAADVTIKGKVFDIANGTGLPGANIILKRNQGTMTNEKGLYVLTLPPGNITLNFQFIGYKPVTRTLQLKSGENLELNVGLELEISEIDQVVVSASKIEQRISELTVSMSVIKPALLSGNHITDAQELINKTSGIEVLDGQASIRGGSGFSYGAGSRVLALVDGLPVMAADAGNIRWQFMPIDNISQIEIIKGASSVAYGSSALNGVINFRTADASNTPVTKFYLESGIFDQPANKNWVWWNSPRIFSNASVNHLQKFGNTDFGIGANLLMDNGYRKLNDEKLGRLNLKLKHRNKNIEGLVYGLTINGGATKKTDFVLWEDATTGALKHDESTAIQLSSTFFTIDPFVTLRQTDRFKHELRARLQLSDNNFAESAKNNSNAYNVYAEYQFWNKLSDLITLNTGVNQNYSKVMSNFYGDHQGFNAGAFAQFDISPFNRLKIVSGVRIEHNSLDGINDKLIPLIRAGINYKALDYTFLRASFGQGYRFPSIAEKHASTTLGSVKIFPNPNIDSESGWNSEIGIKQGILTRYFQGQLDLAVFYSQNKDMIEYIFGIYPDPANGEFGYGFKATNIEATRVYGFELEYVVNKTIGKVTNTINGGYVFMYPAEINPFTNKNTGEMLKYRRKHAATINLTSTYRKFDFGVSLYVKSKILRIDDVFLNPLTRESLLPGFYDYWMNNNNGYLLIDASMAYPVSDRFKISLMVKNLTNTEYMGRPGDIQPQRNFSLRLSGNL